MGPMIGMYLNVFRHRKRAEIELSAYAADARELERLAREQPGFIAFRRYHSNDGESLSGIGMGKRGRRAGVAGSSRAWGRAAAR